MPIQARFENILYKILVAFKEHYLVIAIVLFSFALRMLWLETSIEADEGMFGYNAWLWGKKQGLVTRC